MELKKKLRRTIFNFNKLLVLLFYKTRLDILISVHVFILIFLLNKKTNNKKNIMIVLNRRLWDDNIKILYTTNKDYHFIFFPECLRAMLYDEMIWIWKPYLCKQTFFYKHKDNMVFKRYQTIHSNILKMIQCLSQKNISFILSANIDYYQEYPWIKAIHDYSGKFIVLNKESVYFLPSDIEYVTNMYIDTKFIFEGDIVMFYNEFSRQILIQTNVLNMSNTFVVGCPRVDNYSKLRQKKIDNSFILLSCFMNSWYQGTNLWSEVIDVINNDNNLKKKILVKCRNIDEIVQLKKKYPSLWYSYDPMDSFLCKKPGLLIGFNSTSCFDAMAIGVPVLIPFWTEDKDNSYIFKKCKNNLYLTADNVKSFKDLLNKPFVDIVSDGKDFSKFMNTFYSFIDGHCCDRFYNVLKKFV